MPYSRHFVGLNALAMLRTLSRHATNVKGWNIEEDSSCPVFGSNSRLAENSSSSTLCPKNCYNDSTGFSPAELVHGENLRTHVMLLYEKLTDEEPVESSVVDYVFELINRMKRCQESAILHMEEAKQKQKLWYDHRTIKHQFQPGKLVLVIAPSRPNKLSVQWVGPGEIVQQLSETNYEIKFPEKDKTNVYHVNMLKPYYQREENINLLCINPLKHDEEDMPSLELENEMSG
ncbi:retrovirus-related Pol polyprotein from transposon 412 [Trichonephila clavipes]|nr:retrovirus-related Pol polyprotein from transposon 412 [Trichonephila clavipes]